MRWAFEKKPCYVAVDAKSIMAQKRSASDAADKAPRIQCARRVEAGLDGSHERQGIAGESPGVESLHIRRTMKHGERAADFLELRPQDGQRAVQIVGRSFHAEPAETRCMQE